MLAELTPAQLAEWEAFAELEPFGPLRDDLRAGRVAAAVLNAAPFRGRGARHYGAADFFDTLRRPGQSARKSVADQWASVQRLIGRGGGPKPRPAPRAKGTRKGKGRG